MTIEHQPERPPQRATDRDRDDAAAVIQEAHGDGRLDAAELDERLGRIYSSRTLVELREVTADLVPADHRDSGPLEIVARHSTQVRRGRWRVPSHIVATARHSTIKLDFTETQVRLPEVLIEAEAEHGSVVLLIPPGWDVDVDEVRTDHSRIRNKTAPPRPGATRLRVTGLARHGNIVVRHPRRPRWWWPWMPR